MIKFVGDVNGRNVLKPGLHPRTGFMIFFPGFVILCLIALWLVSPNLQKAENLWLGFVLLIAVISIGALYGRWDDLGNAVRWDQDAIYIRQNHPDWGRWGHRGYARIPYDQIEAVVTRAPPRGVPPLFPLLEVVVREEVSHPETHFSIDPNYFRVAPLLDFLRQVRTLAPQINAGENGKRLDKVMAAIDRNRMPWD